MTAFHPTKAVVLQISGPRQFGRLGFAFASGVRGAAQQRVRVDTDFLLISLGTGIIASIIAGR
jgi:hypothetical protein